MIIIINSPLPLWAQLGEARPPLWLKEYFHKMWRDELMKCGAPREVGKYLAEEIMSDIKDKYTIKG